MTFFGKLSRQLKKDVDQHIECGNNKEQSICLSLRERKEFHIFWLLVAFTFGLLSLANPMPLNSFTYKYDLLVTKICSRTNFNRSQSCQSNDFKLHETIKHCGFQELCKSGFKARCINTFEGEMAHICVETNLSCVEGVWRKAWIDKDIVITQEEECPHGKFQMIRSNCFDACHSVHLNLTDLPEWFTIYSKGDHKSPAYVYCNYKIGYINLSNKTLLNYDQEIEYNPLFCRNQTEVKWSCGRNENPLPNGTCVSECMVGECRDDHDDFLCKRNCSFEGRTRDLPDKNARQHKGKKTNLPEKVTEESFTQPSPSDTKLYIILILIGVFVIVCGIIIIIVLLKKGRNSCNISADVTEMEPPRNVCENTESEGKERKELTVPLLHSEPETDQDLGYACSNKNRGKEHQLKKCVDDTLTPSVMNNLRLCAESCGALIYDGDLAGTVFLVGVQYVMTAFHVIESFIGEIGNTSNKVFVNFAESVCDNNCRTYKVKVAFTDNDKDVAVLELVDGDKAESLPKPLLLWPKNADDVSDISVIGYGHENNPYKKHVEKCKILSDYETERRIREGKNYLEQRNSDFTEDIRSNGKDDASVQRGYSGCDNSHVHKFDCFMSKGLSGGPILTNSSSSARVIGIVLGMKPEVYYNLSHSKQLSFPKDMMFEYGLKMDVLYNHVMSIDGNLAINIFPPTE